MESVSEVAKLLEKAGFTVSTESDDRFVIEHRRGQISHPQGRD